jgi:hypothetical protein
MALRTAVENGGYGERLQMYRYMIATDKPEQIVQRELRSPSRFLAVSQESAGRTSPIEGNGTDPMFMSTARREAEELAEWKHPLQCVAAYQAAIGRWSQSVSANRDEIEVALAGMDTSIARLRELLAEQCHH